MLPRLAGYNRGGEVPTLVGNFVEERLLKEYTGISRFEVRAMLLKVLGPRARAHAAPCTG